MEEAMSLNIVLVEPEIPQNTGNIARTCAATGARLHLVEPLGFQINDRQLKRSGLDYWHLLEVKNYPDLDSFFEQNPGRYFFASTKATQNHAEVPYADGDYLIFGKETKGLPEELLRRHYASAMRIPMISEARSLNLSNAVAIVVYEALRQLGFPGMKLEGSLKEY
jgi:tRNA (cytidine/uridine-2'-O-)-methyltransferase